MKAVRIHKFHETPVIDEVPEPTITGPLDVIVKIGGAGRVPHRPAHHRRPVGRRDGHTAPVHPRPRERRLGARGRLRRDQRAVGDTVILHPTPTCGLCRACRAGDDMHCENSTFPGLSTDGGMAEYLLTSARACVKLDPSDAAAGRRRPRRRGDHRLPRRPQGAPAALPGHHRRGHRGGRPRPHRHPVPGRPDRDGHRRRRPQPRRAQARRAARRQPHGRRRRHARRRGEGPDERQGRARRARLRGRAGRGDGRVEHDRPGRPLLRDRLRRHRCTSRPWTSSPPSGTSSATSSAPTTTSPS